ncbi:hypothetical protein JCM10914_5781 [Paenibacillus sp. JCM 10914]|nr:hypothetical protein JCM10914_5781 [Paenibacillus sp. JCM 10914]
MIAPILAEVGGRGVSTSGCSFPFSFTGGGVVAGGGKYDPLLGGGVVDAGTTTSTAGPAL